MNRTKSLWRKLTYLAILLAMLIPLFLLGQPSGGKGDPGGQLSVMRHEYNIAESDLGEISPASETMKLASLGMRGVAATLLWNKAHTYKVMHEWDRLKATLNNIALLQPHFDKVWEHQAHNLAYNVSTEFDDYRQRYEMVREGTEFLTRGVRQNTNAPRLVWYTGWFYGQKLGMSDEKVQFRRLFSDDDMLHDALKAENIGVDTPEARGPLGKPDNWLVGRLWLNHGYEIVDSGVKIRRQTPLNFYETGPKWRIKHAESIESEGILDARAQNAWQMADDDWLGFGTRSIPTTSPFTIKLNQLEDLEAQRDEKIEEFRLLNEEAFAAARQARIDTLPAVIKEYWQKPESEMTPEQRQLMPSILKGLVPDLTALAKTSDDSIRLESVNIAGQVRDLNERIQKTIGYRTQINYPYWKTLAQAEQEERTVTARRLIYEAEQANNNAELDQAIELYEQAFVIWADIFDDYPLLTIDDTAEDLFNSVRRYMVAIDSQEIPEDFPLATFVTMMGEFGQVDARMYETVRQESKIAAEQRRIELQEEEKKRQIEAEKADEAEGATESESSASGTDASAPDAPEKNEPEKVGDDVSKESVQSDPTGEAGNNDAGENAKDNEGNPAGTE
ncbi:MAG: IRE (iron responsive element) [Rubripirellula sp.]|jgi:hypothetical protein